VSCSAIETAGPTDRDLMARLGAGDREALSPLMARHYQRLYRIALSYLRDADEALDVVQETFVKAFRSAPSWNTDSEVTPWLTRIAVNQSIDVYRRRRHRQSVIEALPDDPERDLRIRAGDPSPERTVLSRELSERISAALRGLPQTQRAIFVLRHYEELSLEEIAKTLGLSLGTVKSGLHRALRRLRPRLAGLRGEA
jgi:RNA polymerase sigma-70 factor, ECF subfamily